jgi:predicted nucleotidyltransferase component of viral defense system
MIESTFKQQVSLLLEIISDVFANDELALKGGTAINLFVQDLPRLSVDIDVAYIKISDRTTFISRISEITTEICRKLRTKSALKVFPNRTSDGFTNQIRVEDQSTSIKIDINFIMRGTVYDCVQLNSSEMVKNVFKKSVKIKCLSFEDLYAGKFCAALDRSHPRDLFDLFIFFKSHKMTKKLKIAFIVYLLSSNRPIFELLDPLPNKDLEELFKKEFEGMVEEAVTIEELKESKNLLINSIHEALNENDRKFLISFKSGDPIWDLFPFESLKDMPSIKWKLYNIKNMPRAKHEFMLQKLKDVLKAPNSI